LNYREILAESDFSVWEEMAGWLASSYEIKIIQQPETFLVMMPAQDSVEQSTFYLGEVLITEAVVEICGTPGYGFAMEDNPAQALAYAIINAALAHGVPEAADIEVLMVKQEAIIESQRRQEERLIASTRVNFSILEG